MAGGRPSKLPRAGQILAGIRAGCYPEQAAQAAGVSASTFYAWKARGEREKTGRYRDFLEELRKAEAEAERNAVEIWRSAIDDEGDWRAAQAFLERRFRDRWGRHQTSELVGPGGGPLQAEQRLRFDASKLGEEDLELMRALSERALVDPDE